jgi:hypothetical protein
MIYQSMLLMVLVPLRVVVEHSCNYYTHTNEPISEIQVIQHSSEPNECHSIRQIIAANTQQTATMIALF